MSTPVTLCRFRSRRHPSASYTVTLDLDGRWTCSCPAGVFRKRCVHLDAAKLVYGGVDATKGRPGKLWSKLWSNQRRRRNGQAENSVQNTATGFCRDANE